jgi:hypothetical protein
MQFNRLLTGECVLFTKCFDARFLIIETKKSKSLLLTFSMCVFSTLFTSSSKAATCDQVSDTHPIFKKISQCHLEKAARTPLLVGQVGKPACQDEATTPGSEAALDTPLCLDPIGAVCEKGALSNANVLDSECRFTVFNSQDAIHTPGFVRAQCEVTQRFAAFSQKHPTQCPLWAFHLGKLSATCLAALSPNEVDELQNLYPKVIYKKSRIDLAKKHFDRTKNRFISLILKSKTIPPHKKGELVKKLQASFLETNLSEILNPANAACYRPDPAIGAPTTISNSDGRVRICLGVMANFDDSNPYLLETIFAHELAHSIDPCTLEYDHWDNQKTITSIEAEIEKPILAQKYYPKIIECLRGGGGPRGCSKSSLNCTTVALVEETCRSSTGLEKAQCKLDQVSLPTCVAGAPHQGYESRDLSSYRQSGAPVEQINESLADYFAAEVTGSLLQDDIRNKKATPRDQRDALISMASVFARIHGVCKRGATLDPHPFGDTRLREIFMRSDRFKKAIGCARAVNQTGAQKPPCPAL